MIGSTLTKGNTNVWVTRKISPAGASVLTRRWKGDAGDDDHPEKVITTSQGSAIYVCGSSQAATAKATVLVRYSATGRRVWQRRFSTLAANSIPGGMCFDSRGAILVCGERLAIDPSKADAIWCGGYAVDPFSQRDALVVKYTARGARRWLWRVDSSSLADDTVNALALSGSGDLHAVAASLVPPADFATLILKLRR